MAPDYNHLIRQLTSDNVTEQTVARMIILSLQEDAVTGLSDVYYAGVTEHQGIAILDILAQIGGPDALAVLRNVYEFEETHMSFKRSAASGLFQNIDNLSQYEREDIALFLASSA